MTSEPTETQVSTPAPPDPIPPAAPPRKSLVTRLFLAAGGVVLFLVAAALYFHVTQERPTHEEPPSRPGPDPVKVTAALRTIDAEGSVEVLTFSPDPKEQLFAWGTAEGNVQLWELASGKRFAHQGPAAVTALTFVAEGKTWLTAYANGALESRDATTGAVVKMPEVKLEGIVRALAYSPDTFFWIAGATSKDGKAGRFVWHDERQLRDRKDSSLATHPLPNWSIAFSPEEGQRMATGGDQGAVRIWDPATGQFTEDVTVGVDQVRSLAFALNFQLAVACIKSVELWDLNSNKLHLSLPAKEGEIRCVACSRKGDLLAWGEGPMVKVYDIVNGRVLAILSGHTKLVRALAFSPDGKTLATGGEDRTIRLWDLKGLNKAP